MSKLSKIVLSIFAALSPHSLNGEVITLRADAWCPYTCEPEAAKPGFIIEIAKKALEPAGHRIDYKTLNWARSIADTRKGKFTALPGAAKADAPDFIFPKEAVAQQKMCFFADASSNWTYTSVASLDKIVLGAIKDYAYTPDIDTYIKKQEAQAQKVDLVASDNPLELNVKKLQAKRIDAFIDDHYATLHYLKSMGPASSKIKEVGCASSADLYIAFSPQNARSKEFATLIQDKIVAMRKDGSLKKLLDTYEVVDWKRN